MARAVAILTMLAGLLSACGDDASTPCDASDAADCDASDGADVPGRRFVEEFRTVPAWLLPSGTTAIIDTQPPGYAHGAYWPVDDDTGDGSEGAWDSGSGPPLTSGEHAFVSAAVTSDQDVDGDLVLRVQGAFHVLGGSLVVRGDLTIVAGGAIDLSGGDVRAEGDVRIHAPGTETVRIALGRTLTAGGFPPGSVDIRARGPVSVVGDVVAAESAVAGTPGGSIAIRAYGDVDLGGGRLFGGDGHPGGTVEVWTEGSLSLGGSAAIVASGTGAGVVIRVDGDLALAGGSTVRCGGGATLEAIVAGTAALTDGSLFDCAGSAPSDVTLAAAGVLVGGGASLGTGAAAPGTPGGDLRVDSTNTVRVLDGAILSAGDAECAAGGTLQVLAAGDVTVGDRSCLRGGDSLAGTGCAAARGGDVVVQTRADFTRSGALAGCETGYCAGTGDPDGDATLETGPTVTIPPIRSGVVWDATVRSGGISTGGASGAITSVGTVWDLADGTTGTFEISPDGTSGGYVAGDAAVGLTLQDGWRLRATMRTRLLDAARLDEIVVEY